MAKSKMQIQMELKSKQKGGTKNMGSNTASGKLKTGKKTKTSVRNQSKPATDFRSRQYSLGADNTSASEHYYKFTGKQTKNWKPVGKQLKDYLYHLIDSSVRMVESKPQFSKDEDVQKILNELKLQLKAKMHTIKVPNKRHGDYSKMKARTDELKEELESVTQQQLQLEKAIREEERAIEEMEELQNTSSRTPLVLKIPDEQLDLPKMLF